MLFSKYDQRHLFHLVDPSPWPLFGACGTLITFYGVCMYAHLVTFGLGVLIWGICATSMTAYLWWRDTISEGTFEGHHTLYVQDGLSYGMILFIISEVLFFFGFFWAYFHSALAPAIEIGSHFPPLAISVFDPWGVPFLNTVLLLSSGAAVTWAHHSMLIGLDNNSYTALHITLVLAIFFTFFQVYEYLSAMFSISDSVYGSIFFLATGFHGFHVLIGTFFLLVCTLSVGGSQFTTLQHVGFEAGAWYWHFVDVVWLILFIFIYWWPQTQSLYI